MITKEFFQIKNLALKKHFGNTYLKDEKSYQCLDVQGRMKQLKVISSDYTFKLKFNNYNKHVHLVNFDKMAN